MPLIDLTSIPRTELSFMDADHQLEANLLNELAQAVDELGAGGGSPDAVVDRFDALLRHTAEHFERENEAMRRTGFPPYPVHRGEHDRVLGEMRAARDAFAGGGPLEALRRYVVDATPAWFRSHILTMDTVTSGFIRAHGG
jgi:hemerythrin